VDLTVASPSEQAEEFWRLFVSSQKSKLSSLEQDECLTDEHFCSTSEFSGEHTTEGTAAFVKSIVPNWKERFSTSGSSEEYGQPLLLVICSSALRCLDVIRALREVSPEAKVAKLFAKHLKLEEQEKWLRRIVKIGVGTPRRVSDLINKGALSLESCEHLILDASHKDVKNYTLLSNAAMRTEFMDFYYKHCHSRVLAGKFKLCMW